MHSGCRSALLSIRGFIRRFELRLMPPADCDGRERLCAPARAGAVARPIPRRADHLPERQARRPGRLDRANARLVQERRPRARIPRLLPHARAIARGGPGRLMLTPCGIASYRESAFEILATVVLQYPA